jgi:hypothetical protein
MNLRQSSGTKEGGARTSASYCAGNAVRRRNATPKSKDMADLIVFLTALGMAIVAWLIQRALSGK